MANGGGTAHHSVIAWRADDIWSELSMPGRSYLRGRSATSGRPHARRRGVKKLHAERRDAQDEFHSAAQARAWADGDFDADHGLGPLEPGARSQRGGGGGGCARALAAPPAWVLHRPLIAAADGGWPMPQKKKGGGGG
jgi:hypothetical protein